MFRRESIAVKNKVMTSSDNVSKYVPGNLQSIEESNKSSESELSPMMQRKQKTGLQLSFVPSSNNSSQFNDGKSPHFRNTEFNDIKEESENTSLNSSVVSVK